MAAHSPVCWLKSTRARSVRRRRRCLADGRRWATRAGRPTAGSPMRMRIHTGIIENHADLRRELQATGRHTFTSQTDTEVVCHLLEDELRQDELAADTDTESRGAGG